MFTAESWYSIYSVVVFFGNSEFKDVTCNADNTFLIYPRSIRQVVSAILMQPDANLVINTR